jgi:hypothetical protein
MEVWRENLKENNHLKNLSVNGSFRIMYAEGTGWKIRALNLCGSGHGQVGASSEKDN